MGRAVLTACLPWLGLLALSCLVLWLLARLNRARLEWGRLGRLHGDQAGSVQSFSFVLTLPLFIMVVLFILQISQLWIATIVVHYAAFAAARSAIVWIPARVDPFAEPENCIGHYQPHPDPRLPHDPPTFTGPCPGGMTYLIYYGTPERPLAYPGTGVLTPAATPKCRKILAAAVMALTPIGPSLKGDSGGSEQAGSWGGMLDSMERAFHAVAPSHYATEDGINRRMARKLAYTLENAAIEIRFYHANSASDPERWPWTDAPLHWWDMDPDRDEFRALWAMTGSELGWQDPITVTVYYNLQLLPGPAKFLYGLAPRPPDWPLAPLRGDAYPIRASATLGNEGEKSVIPYVESMD